MIVPTAAENRDTGSNQLNTDMDLPRLDKSGSHWTQEHLDSLHVHLRADVPLGLFSFLFSFFFSNKTLNFSLVRGTLGPLSASD